MSGANGASTIDTELHEIRTAIVDHVDEDRRVQASILDHLDRISRDTGELRSSMQRLELEQGIIRVETQRHGKAIGELLRTDAVQTSQLDSVRPKLASLHEEQVKLSLAQRHPKTLAGAGAAVAAALGALANSDAVARLIEALVGQ